MILDIFAARARTREARLQIELAQLEYSLPRLTRAWSHLGRQGGGIGGRGEGESQLEQDRRRSWKAMDKLKAELKEIRSARATQRKDRQRTPVPNCAIVGYTNSGKSSLLRRLTGAEVLVEDKLLQRSTRRRARSRCPRTSPCCSRTRWALCASFRTVSSRRSRPLSRRPCRRTFSCICWMRARPRCWNFTRRRLTC